MKNNLEKVPAAVRTDISVVVYQDAQNGDASLTNEQANVTGENTNAVILNAVFEVSSAMNFDAADEAAEVYSGELSETDVYKRQSLQKDREILIVLSKITSVSAAERIDFSVRKVYAEIVSWRLLTLAAALF